MHEEVSGQCRSAALPRSLNGHVSKSRHFTLGNCIKNIGAKSE